MIIKTVRILCVLALVMLTTPKGNALAVILPQEISFEIFQQLPQALHFDRTETTQGLWSITQLYEFDMFDPALGTLNGVDFRSDLVPMNRFFQFQIRMADPPDQDLLSEFSNMLTIDTGLVTQAINVNVPGPPAHPGMIIPLEVPPLGGSEASLDPSLFVGTGSFPLDATWSGQLLVNPLNPIPGWVVEIVSIEQQRVAATLTLSLLYDYEPGTPQQPVPEPATMLLLASGLVGLAGLRRKFRKR